MCCKKWERQAEPQALHSESISERNPRNISTVPKRRTRSIAAATLPHSTLPPIVRRFAPHSCKRQSACHRSRTAHRMAPTHPIRPTFSSDMVLRDARTPMLRGELPGWCVHACVDTGCVHVCEHTAAVCSQNQQGRSLKRRVRNPFLADLSGQPAVHMQYRACTRSAGLSMSSFKPSRMPNSSARPVDTARTIFSEGIHLQVDTVAASLASARF